MRGAASATERTRLEASAPSHILRARDVKAVLDLVGEVSGADTLGEFRRTVVDGLHRLIPSDYVSYNEFDARGVPLYELVVPEIPEREMVAWRAHAHENPLVIRHAATRDGRAYRFSDVTTTTAFRATALYQDFYRTVGIRHQVAFALPSDPSMTHGIALSRWERDYGERHRAMLNLARSHLIQAYRLAEARERAMGLLDALTEGLDDAGAPFAVMQGGEVTLASPRAREIIRHLRDAQVISDAGRPLPRSARTLELGGELIVAREVVVGSRTVVLFDGMETSRLEPALQGLGLTAREAEVLAMLAKGHTTKDIARAMGISPRTVLKHGERINAKLGTRDRTQAVATAVAALRVAPNTASP